MNPVRFVMVGGFLGAGKTTLLATAAQRLAASGRRVGLITNDQAADLVDTELLRRTDAGVREVAGGCFCCGFNRLLHACDELIDQFQPDILLGEPVGSCADLSATVIQPIKRYCADKLEVGPFTVLADPHRLSQALTGDGHPADDVEYIYLKQLEEADRIVLSKIDLVSADQRARLVDLLRSRFGEREIMELSAVSDAGLDAWLAYITSDAPGGRRIAEIDYDTYAAGEAALGWLNALIRVRADGGADWRRWCVALLEEIRDRCKQHAASIGHVKLLLRAVEGSLSANLIDVETPPTVDGDMPETTEAASLIFNARVAATPKDLERWVVDALAAAADGAVTTEIAKMRCFRPSRPEPEHRLSDLA